MPLERANSKSSLLAELEALKARIEVEDAAEPSGEPPIVFVLDDTLACPTCHRQLPARRAEIHACTMTMRGAGPLSAARRARLGTRPQ